MQINNKDIPGDWSPERILQQILELAPAFAKTQEHDVMKAAGQIGKALHSSHFEPSEDTDGHAATIKRQRTDKGEHSL